MKNVMLNYKTIERGERAYFYGANSERGFVFCDDPLLNEKALYEKTIIKGGPGTGKSTLMKIRKCCDGTRIRSYLFLLFL